MLHAYAVLDPDCGYVQVSISPSPSLALLKENTFCHAYFSVFVYLCDCVFVCICYLSQGMSYIAAVSLLYMVEEEAFWVYLYILRAKYLIFFL